jgi:hypothetical protein
MEKDPEGFHQRMRENALKAGFQVSDRKPISLKELREKKNKARARKNGGSGKK